MASYESGAQLAGKHRQVFPQLSEHQVLAEFKQGLRFLAGSRD